MHGVGGADCSILKLDVNLYQQDKPKPLTKTILPRVFTPGTDSLKKINPEPTQENYFPEASVIRPDSFEAIDHLFLNVSSEEYLPLCAKKQLRKFKI